MLDGEAANGSETFLRRPELGNKRAAVKREVEVAPGDSQSAAECGCRAGPRMPEFVCVGILTDAGEPE